MSEEHKKVSNNDLRNSQCEGGFVRADTVNADQIGGNINNYNVVVNPRPTLTHQEYRNRQALLAKVKNYWVKGVLKKSLHNQVLMELGLEERPDAITNPLSEIIEIGDNSPQPLPEGTQVIDIFDKIGTGITLLILGEPGSGKTTTLLELARDLIDRAEQDTNQLIPVVFNLSSWAKKRQTIADWLVDELNTIYKVPKKIGQALVSQQQLLLLLDGLDEVKADYRDDCIVALNQFQQDYGAELVVCSRMKDYQALSNRLNFQSAVYIRLLSLEQIYHYLDSVGADLTGLRTLIAKDTVLQELAQSPLMLNIMTLAYQGVAVEYLPKTDVIEERRRQLFDSYIEKMFKRRKTNQQYNNEQVKQWLILLAKITLSENHSILLIEEIQPSWLSNNKQRWVYVFLSRIICGLFFVAFYGILLLIKSAQIEIFYATLFSALIAGVNISLIDKFFWSKNNQYTYFGALKKVQLFHLLSSVIASELVFAFFFKYLIVKKWVIGLPLGLFFGFLFGMRGIKKNINTDIQNFEILNFSWKESIKWTILGLLISLIFSWIIVLLYPKYWDESGKVIIMISGAIGYVFGGLHSVTIEREKKLIPNQGIQYSLRNTALGGIIGGLIGLIVLIFTRRDYYWTLGMSMGALWYGGIACIQHFSLRLVLYFNNYIPWNYARFLDYAADRIFLQKVGGGYIFIHRMLMEHFAEMKP
ncbi:MAG: NACHT domain-containing protein [Moorea sp. SIO3I7]|uniref:NACHT domain-containing protein n=1 Tax=Moorena sp. SIO3I8 TaxID=2607833 RepID=UPI0013BF8FD9|nr:NACHT domain-containing protein [Moorena sp. SIO3I8]NEN96213.1 NACHT domain-containing protein [Moorena sp. SIO3I7]NEO06132.1 NACHT domain-containing protein [Moorena sp. SIO3I8]